MPPLTAMTPIRWEENRLLILNQKKLPGIIEWISISNAKEMGNAIREMNVRGAPLLGIAAAYSLALESQNFKISNPGFLLSHLENSAKMLLETRPTAVNLSVSISRILKKAREALQQGKLVASVLREEAKRIHKEDEAACLRMGQLGSDLLPLSGSVLTHCNTGALATGGEGTAYAIIKQGYRRGKVSHVYVCESRPYLQGARLTAFELQQDQIPFTLITDSMAAYFFFQRKIQAVVVGADRIASNGDVVNKIGTYGLAVLAKEHQVPFYVAASTSTLDENFTTGEDIPIEQRSPQEVTQLMGVSIAPQGIQAAHPAFDCTPSGFIQAIITEAGVAVSPYQTSLQRLMRES